MTTQAQLGIGKAFDRYLSGRSERASMALSVQNFYPINKTLARVVAQSENFREISREAVQRSLVELYNDSIMVLPRGISEATANGKRFITAFVTPNHKIKNYDANSTKGMKAVAANVFSDDGDNIWEVRGEGDDRVLVQIAGDGIEELLNARRSRVHMATAALHIVPELTHYCNGDYLLYMTPAETVSAGFGFHLAGSGPDSLSYVYDRKKRELIAFHPAQIINVASDLDDHGIKVPGNKAEASLDRSELKEYLDYMGILFKGTEYFAKLEQLMEMEATLPAPVDTTPMMERHRG